MGGSTSQIRRCTTDGCSTCTRDGERARTAAAVAARTLSHWTPTGPAPAAFAAAYSSLPAPAGVPLSQIRCYGASLSAAEDG